MGQNISNDHSRRDFLRQGAALMGTVMGASLLTGAMPLESFAAVLEGDDKSTPWGRIPLLSFSTLGCPDWSFSKIVDFAAANGYKGLELRGILRQLDLPKCPEFDSPAHIADTMRLMESKGLKFVDLGSSAEMHHADPAERKTNLEGGKRFIDLAAALHCPYVRVFPNILPKDQDRNATIDLIVSGLRELGEYAARTGVIVLMESHGELIHSDDLKKIMDSANHPHVGMVWDIFNMWSVTKEPPAAVYANLKKYIHHTHIKDGKTINGKEQYMLMGQGESPIFEAIDILEKNGYKGYYSFEWEKLWHPELADPAIALADYPVAMKKHFQR